MMINIEDMQKRAALCAEVTLPGDTIRELLATIQQLEARVKEARQQEAAWRIAFEGLERQHKALTDQIPTDMIQADPILVERLTAAAAMEEIGREQIADLQARVKELELRNPQ